MKKTVAKKIQALIKKECILQGVQYHKSMYRRAKTAYATVPKTKRHLVG